MQIVGMSFQTRSRACSSLC
ncbi:MULTISPECIES: hypothetical protein [Blautia]